MTQKNYCDECGEEIKDWFGLHGRISFFGRIEGDFCSKECLKKFVEKL